jgi:predicted nucleic acid-binding protein
LIVVDASSVVEALLRGPAADAIDARWLESGGLHSVQLLDLEVLQALRRLVRAGQIDDDRASEAALDFAALRVRRWSHVPLRDRVWQLRHNVTAYDAAYIALAERFDCPLITRDGRLKRASGHTAKVEVI